jgi:uncharacterized membrane protein YjjP (DUF1212 family)
MPLVQRLVLVQVLGNFVTMGAEQFGTNLRATARYYIPNMVAWFITLINLMFVNWFQKKWMDIVKAAIYTGIIVMAITLSCSIFY